MTHGQTDRRIGKHCYCYLTIPYDYDYDDDVDVEVDVDGDDDDDGNQYHEHVRIRLVLLFHHNFLTPLCQPKKLFLICMVLEAWRYRLYLYVDGCTYICIV